MDKQNENNSKSEEPKSPKFPWLILIIVISLWCVNLLFGFWAFGSNKAKGGEWGDIFGAVNALFSALAFLMIYYGIQMQRYEVRLAKSELAESKKQTQEILKQSQEQKNALDKQNEATERQMFENTFFKFLDDYNDIVERLQFKRLVWQNFGPDESFLRLESGNDYTGKRIFSHLSYWINKLFADDFDDVGWIFKELNKNDFNLQYKFFRSATKELLGPYFRTVYNILKYLELSKIEDKKFYSNIFRAQMSDNEIKVLAFNSASELGIDKLLPLLKEYKFLKYCSNNFNEISFLNIYIGEEAFK